MCFEKLLAVSDNFIAVRLTPDWKPDESSLLSTDGERWRVQNKQTQRKGMLYKEIIKTASKTNKGSCDINIRKWRGRLMRLETL